MEKEFSKDLEETIFSLDNQDRVETLTIVFKSCVVNEIILLKIQEDLEDGIEADMLNKVKNEIISGFRNASLQEYQRSVEQYEMLFDTTLSEMLNEASLAHEGIDSATFANQMLDINAEMYRNEGGGKFMRGNNSGLYLPTY